MTREGAIFMIDVSDSWRGVWRTPARYVSRSLETYVAQLALYIEFMRHPSTFVNGEFAPEFVERFKQELCVMDPDALSDESTTWQDIVEELECPF